MRVIGSANYDEIEFLAVGIKHFSEILVALCLWELFEAQRPRHLVDFCYRNDVFATAIAKASFSDSTRPDKRYIESAIGGIVGLGYCERG